MLASKLTLHDLEALHLEHGSHVARAEGVCAMEAAAWLAGREHNDAPICVSPIIRRVMIQLNDGLEDEPRQRLKPYLPKILKTADDARAERRRAAIASEWALTTVLPLWLDALELGAQAEAIRRGGRAALSEALPVIEKIRDEARARARALALDLALDLALARARALDLDLDLARARALDLDLARYEQLVKDLTTAGFSLLDQLVAA